VRDNADRESVLPVVVLMLVRKGKSILLPDDGLALALGDLLLLAGRHQARSILNLTLQNANALDYLLTGGRQAGWASMAVNVCQA
jgi:voltage-gated potassium channel